MTIRRILYATDFTRTSRPALALARALAGRFKAELIVFHALERVLPVVAVGHAMPAKLEERWTETAARARRKLQTIARTTKIKGVRITTVMAEGRPDAAIVRAAQARRVSLIVIGTGRSRGVERWLLGSVAGRIVQSSRTPVLTVRASR